MGDQQWPYLNGNQAPAGKDLQYDTSSLWETWSGTDINLPVHPDYEWVLPSVDLIPFAVPFVEFVDSGRELLPVTTSRPSH
jgi:hypothetical protein